MKKEKYKLKNKTIDLISLKICREKSHIYSDTRINNPKDGLIFSGA